MAVTAHTYTKLADALANKEVDLSGTPDSIKCMLLASYTVGTTQDTAKYLADVTAVATEASGTGYTAGGVALTSVTWTVSGHVYALKGTIPPWDTTGGSLAAAYAVFYDDTPASNKPVLCYWNLDGAGGTQTSSNGSFTLTQNASGILTLTGS